MKVYNGTAGLFLLDTLTIVSPIVLPDEWLLLSIAWIFGILSLVSTITCISSYEVRSKIRKKRKIWSQFFIHYDLLTDLLFLIVWAVYGWYWVVAVYLVSILTLKWVAVKA